MRATRPTVTESGAVQPSTPAPLSAPGETSSPAGPGRGRRRWHRGWPMGRRTSSCPQSLMRSAAVRRRVSYDRLHEQSDRKDPSLAAPRQEGEDLAADAHLALSGWGSSYERSVCQARRSRRVARDQRRRAVQHDCCRRQGETRKGPGKPGPFCGCGAVELTRRPGRGRCERRPCRVVILGSLGTIVSSFSSRNQLATNFVDSMPCSGVSKS